MKMLMQVFLLALGVIAVAAADEPISDATGNRLAAKYNCVSCHSLYDSSMQGPSYRDIAKKYASDTNARDELSASILNGSSGTWGSNTMPSNDIPQDDLKKLVEWILAQFP
ncbi:MAG: c-type cytochrome [Steroidobacteraceae bacterium]